MGGKVIIRQGVTTVESPLYRQGVTTVTSTDRQGQTSLNSRYELAGPDHVRLEGGAVGGDAGSYAENARLAPGGGGGRSLGLNAARGAKATTSYRSLYAPRFFIEADGKLAQDLIPFISSFEYEDDEAKIDVLRITVMNQGLRFKDDPRFKEGVRFRVRFGYLDDISQIYSCVITKAKPHFPQNGVPTIQMIAYGLQRDMNLYGNPMNHGPVSSSEVAHTIADRYKFKKDIEDSKDARRQNRVQSAGVTDIQYLMSLASKLNWEAFIEHDTLHFHPKRYDKPAVLEFTYFTDDTGTLLQFSPDVNMNQAPQQQKAGADTKKGDATSAGRAEKPKERVLVYSDQSKLGSLIPNTPAGPRGKIGAGLIGATAETDPKVIEAHGSAQSEKIDMSALKASADMIGTPRVRAREMIRISGVDQQYTGNWRVCHSKHSITPGQGYKVSVTLKRDAGKANSPEQNKTNPGAAAGGSAGTGDAGRVTIDTNNTRIIGGGF